MNFKSIQEIKAAGFTGFKTMSELFVNSSGLPSVKGVYMVLNLDGKEPSFLEVGTGGFFKGKNPNVALSVLQNNWVADAPVVYIGKAGGEQIKSTLKTRLRQYFGFGQGKNIGHQGGRLIWQLDSARQLVVCWKTLPNDDPRTYERNLLNDFVGQFGVRPFANLID